MGVRVESPLLPSKSFVILFKHFASQRHAPTLQPVGCSQEANSDRPANMLINVVDDKTGFH